jgi:hypothetical protein
MTRIDRFSLGFWLFAVVCAWCALIYGVLALFCLVPEFMS